MIRLWRLGDVFALRDAAESTLSLDTTCSLVAPQSPVRTALASRIPFRRLDSYTYVYDNDGTIEAFAQAQTRRNTDDVDVVCLGASFSGSIGRGVETRDVWVALLEQLCITAGRIGRRRIFARVPVGHEETEVFARAGFVPYCREDVYRLQYSGPVTPPNIACRVQQDADAWPVHQLYNATTPKNAKQAEGISSSYWEPRGLKRCRGVDQAAYILDGRDKTAVYARVSNRGKSYLLELVYEPDYRDQLSAVIQYLLSTLPGYTGQTVYCLVREYQDGLPDALADHGFTQWSSCELEVKYSVVRVRQPIREHQIIVERHRRMATQPELGGTSLRAIRSLTSAGSARRARLAIRDLLAR